MSIYDEIIKRWAKERDLPWLLVKAQIMQESMFRPCAVSSCGALGLMQIMPGTGAELGFSKEDLFVPEKNIECGTLYLQIQYDHFPEIPNKNDRLKFSLAAYNGGRGYINRALKLARDTGTPHWIQWEISSVFLSSPHCFIKTTRKKRLWPDHKQIIDYVEKIWGYYQEYLEGEVQ